MRLNQIISMKMRLPALAIALLQFVCGAPGAAAQQEASAEGSNRVGIGTVYSLQREGPVDIPVYISLVPSAQVSRVSFDLVFPGEELSWVHAEPGIQADLEVTSEVREDAANPSQTVVHLEISSESSEGIVNGLIASLRLRVHPDVQLGSKPVAVSKLTAMSRSAPDMPVPTMTGYGASVEVVTPEDYPAVVCFFFTH